jgi:predicted Zn-dependent peptidase
VIDRRLACLILLLGLALPMLFGQADSDSATTGTPKVEPVQRTLLNDLNTMWLPLHRERFVLHLVVMNGSVFDPPSKKGTAVLTGYLMARLFESKIRTLWSGAPPSKTPPVITVSTTHDGIHFIVTGPPEALPSTGQCLAEILEQPEFPAELFRQVKDKVALEDLRVEDHPETVALQEWLQLVFTPFPYADTPAGTTFSLDAIEEKDIIRFFRRNILPNRSLLVVSAPLTATEFRRFTSQYFGTWVKRDAPPFEFAKPAPDKNPRTLLVSLPQASHGCILMGGEGFRMKHDDYLASLLAMRILQTRLDLIAARRPGYRFQALSQGSMLGGYLLIRVDGPVDPDLAILEEVQATIAGVAAGQFSTDEFQNERRKLLQDYRNRLIQPDQRLDLQVESEWYRLGTRYLDSLPQRLENIIREDIQYIAQNNLAPENVKSVVVTPAPPDPTRIPPKFQPAAAKAWGADTPASQ